jgi:hypothetical protein
MKDSHIHYIVSSPVAMVLEFGRRQAHWKIFLQLSLCNIHTLTFLHCIPFHLQLIAAS